MAIHQNEGLCLSSWNASPQCGRGLGEASGGSEYPRGGSLMVHSTTIATSTPGRPTTTKAIRHPSILAQSRPPNIQPRPIPVIHAPKSAPCIWAMGPPKTLASTPPSVTPIE